LTGRHAASLPRDFYRRDSREVAPDLLNKVLVRGGVAGRIVETEAYVGDIDPAAHAYRGKTLRNATMFGPPGHLYVYFIYGMHWCINPVCADEGVGNAVLIRAVAPLEGLEQMRTRRPRARRDIDLCNGPGKLSQAFAITSAEDGADLVTGGGGGITIVDDGVAPPDDPGQSPRIGLSVAADLPWRWFVRGDQNVSRTRPGPVDRTPRSM
jgi:DNA-3-methyladenine glycosylase